MSIKWKKLKKKKPKIKHSVQYSAEQFLIAYDDWGAAEVAFWDYERELFTNDFPGDPLYYAGVTHWYGPIKLPRKKNKKSK